MDFSVLNENLSFEFKNQISVYIKREDLIHPIVSGNKFRKLKYNLIEARAKQHTQIITFGGAFSNHIAAVAFAGQERGFSTVGVIRGDELVDKIASNPTLAFAEKCGMKFEFVSRAAYQNKNDFSFLEKIRDKYGDFYLIPEGGTNELAVRGCEEILQAEDVQFDYICCSVGTGGTIAGLINSIGAQQKVLGFPALKGDFLKNEIRNFVKNNRWDLIEEYHFGGYGKVDAVLINFMNTFYSKTKILLDPIYTGKMVFGVMDLIQKNYFREGSKILMIHTGGIQGVQGMNNKLKNKKLPLLITDD